MQVPVSSLRLLTLAIALLIAAASSPGLAGAQAAAPAALRDGRHDFDFEFGSWTVVLRRLAEPLTGSDRWVECSGTSVVREVWNGKANLGELEVDCPGGAIQGLSFRLYQPETRQWQIRWASSRDGELGPPMIGGFDGSGRAEFYNQELFGGRAVYVRFIFSGIARDTFRFEQAFSADGGQSWETNWIASFT